jgi:hypothetical protein
MAKSVAFRSIISGDVESTVDKTVTIVTGDAVDDMELTIATGVTDQLVVFACALAAMKGYYIVSDQAISLQTNSSGSPDDTIALVANEPLVWNEKSLHTKAFTVDITALYLTTGVISASAAVRIIFVRDSTP